MMSMRFHFVTASKPYWIIQTFTNIVKTSITLGWYIKDKKGEHDGRAHNDKDCESFCGGHLEVGNV